MTAVKPRTKFVGRIAPSDVHDALSFAAFAQQRLGTPYPTGKAIATLNKSLNEFFEHYPTADFYTMCRVVEWAKQKKKRYPQVYQLVYAFRYAYADGYLPELDPNVEQPDESLEAKIEAALKVEKDDEWRRRLMIARGVKARTEVFEAWRSR